LLIINQVWITGFLNVFWYLNFA